MLSKSNRSEDATGRRFAGIDGHGRPGPPRTLYGSAPSVVDVYDSILLPTDGSEGTAMARDHAIELARDQGATLHVLHVVDVLSPAASLHEMIEEQLTEQGEGMVEAVASTAAERGVAVETAVLAGDPAERIVEYAASEDVDVIVMPTHGRSGLRKSIIGSVTDRVVRTADVPVVVVRFDG